MEKNKKDYLSTTILYQFLVCAMLFGALFALNNLRPECLKSIKYDFFDNLNDNSVIENSEFVVDKKPESLNTSEFHMADEDTKNDSEDALIPEVGVGGNDVDISDKNVIPDNVSVNNYSLNQQMFTPVKGRITSEYGVRIHPIKENLSFHSGIDIAAQKGTPIKSAFNGVITESEYDEWNGYHIKIQHDNGVMTVYCHCDELLAEKGAKVGAGEVIATVGSTGSSTGPHLHFELRINDICYNPQIALDEAVDEV
ncbi:MAG: M23 family metallopeptidase [Clostridia bacterium]|nr:M23 family metallopeptidase [Clostridia bacterium]